MFLSTFILYMAYTVLRASSEVSGPLRRAHSNHKRTILYYMRVGLLWIGCMMLFLFFASGYYADSIRTANEYVRLL